MAFNFASLTPGKKGKVDEVKGKEKKGKKISPAFMNAMSFGKKTKK